MPRKAPSKSGSSSSTSTRSRRKKDGSVETSESETETTTAINATATTAADVTAIKAEPKKKATGGRGRKKKGTESESESEVETTVTAAGTIINGTALPTANETITSTSNIVPPQTPSNKRRGNVDDTVTKENSDPNSTVSQVRVKERLESILEEFDIEVESRANAMHAEAEKQAHQLRSAFNVDLMKIPKKWRIMTMREFLDVHKGDWSLLFSKTATSVAPTPQRPLAQNKITIKLDEGIELDGNSDITKLGPKAREEAKKRLMDAQAQLESMMKLLK